MAVRLSFVSAGNQESASLRFLQNPPRHFAGSDRWTRLTQDEISFALVNELAPAFAGLMAREVGWAQVPEGWRQAFLETEQRTGNYLAELDWVADRLSQEGIPLVALKNAGIARGIFQHAGACPMGDVDVLIQRRHFRRAHRLLLEMDYHFEFRSPLEESELSVAEESGGSEYWKILPNGQRMWLELQWRPVAGRWIRPDQEPLAEELLARSVPISGSKARLLAPEDNLLQVCLHNAKHSYVRAPGFRLHIDAERIIRAFPALDWNVFLDMVKILKVKTAVYFSLAIPAELMGAPVPGPVLDQIRPARWKEILLRNWIRSAGLFNPHERKFSRMGYVLFSVLLYDDLAGLRLSIFPDRAWMRQHYRFERNWMLPYYHLRRLVNLLFRRMVT